MTQLSKEELAFFDEAVEIAKTLGRPFTQKEVLAHALREGYELKLCFDDRFVKVSARKGLPGRAGFVPPLWALRDDL